jgi:hypothetical protein
MPVSTGALKAICQAASIGATTGKPAEQAKGSANQDAALW